MWWYVLNKTMLNLNRENGAWEGMWLHVFIVTQKESSAGDTNIKHEATARCLYCWSEFESYLFTLMMKKEKQENSCLTLLNTELFKIVQYNVYMYKIQLLTYMQLKDCIKI